MLLKIGELAKRTGLTVRTLHHYDDIKLLSPSTRSEAGYRLYGRRDIECLHRIQALRRLGLSLAEIDILLKSDGADLQTVIEQQIVALDRQVERTVELRDRLKILLTRVTGDIEPDMPDWLTTLELMAIYDKYFTDDEIKKLPWIQEQSNGNTPAQWSPLIAAFRNLMDKNTPPENQEAQELAKRWAALAQEHMGTDIRFFVKIDALHRNEPTVQEKTGVDGAMLDYIAKASEEIRLNLYAKYLNAAEVNKVRGKLGRNYLPWITLTAEVRQQMEQGGIPEGHEVQALAMRWNALVQELWGNDPTLIQKVRAAHQSEPGLLVGTGIDQPMLEFMAHGFACLSSDAK